MGNEAVLTCTHDLCFEQNRKNITLFHLKIIIFTAVKYYSILYGRVFVMGLEEDFRRICTIYGYGGRPGHVSQIPGTVLFHLAHGCFTCKLELNDSGYGYVSM